MANKSFLVCKNNMQQYISLWFLYIRKLSSMQCRNPLKYACLAGLLFHSVSRWWKSLMRTRACNHEATSSSLWKATSTSRSCSGCLQQIHNVATHINLLLTFHPEALHFCGVCHSSLGRAQTYQLFFYIKSNSTALLCWLIFPIVCWDILSTS